MRAALSVLTAAALLVGGGGLLSAAPASADGPGVGTPTVVSVGDSYISGEAGRWAGNTNDGESLHDAGGANAYWDNASRTAEAIDRCHRYETPEIAIGGGTLARNLACSGARTTTAVDGDGRFKPGLDFWSDGTGRVGQALALQQYAATRNVKMVVVSIGGNDFGFGGIVQQCVSDFLGSPSWAPDYCRDDASVTANFTSSNVGAKTSAITTGLLNVRQAMRAAGYADAAWKLVVQTYSSPLPGGSGIRYSQSGYSRQSTGGCGFWNADADWANATALPTINGAVRNAVTNAGIAGSVVLDLSSALNGRRLCESTVGLLEEKGLSSWTQAGASDVTEWVNQIRTVSTCCGNYYVQESFHPNHWGQLALRNCLRQVWNGGAVRAGRCTRGANGRNGYGEPNMVLS
ncbi:MAG: hypothetical protein JWO60_2037 [Frankiales bacterium]|nr:hypothetical protein [Frankiales bacterium]